ncbi:hypothetical protein E4A41_15600, partial [Micrococcus endophyticus]
RGMTRAMKSARPRWIIGRTPGLTLARAQSWPGTRISVTEPGAAEAAARRLGLDLRHDRAASGPGRRRARGRAREP